MRSMPAACHWIEFDDCSRLYWNHGWIATVGADGAVRIHWQVTIEARAASAAQGRRFVERWIAARRGLPPGARALATRQSMLRLALAHSRDGAAPQAVAPAARSWTTLPPVRPAR